MALLTVFLLSAGAIVFFSVFWPVDKNKEETDYRVAAYVTSWNWSEVPDVNKLTHVIYCFAQIDTQTHLMKVPSGRLFKTTCGAESSEPEAEGYVFPRRERSGWLLTGSRN